MEAQLAFAREMLGLAAYAPDKEREHRATEWFDLINALLLSLGPSADDEVVYHLQAFTALSEFGPGDRAVIAPVPATYLRKLAAVGAERVTPAPARTYTVSSVESIRDLQRNLRELETTVAERGKLPPKRQGSRVVRATYFLWLHSVKGLSYSAIVAHWREITRSWEEAVGSRLNDRAAIEHVLDSLPKHQHLLFLEWRREGGVEGGVEELTRPSAQQDVAKIIRNLHPVARASSPLERG